MGRPYHQKKHRYNAGNWRCLAFKQSRSSRTQIGTNRSSSCTQSTEDKNDDEDEDEVEELRMTFRCDYRDASQGSPSCDDLPAYPQASTILIITITIIIVTLDIVIKMWKMRGTIFAASGGNAGCGRQPCWSVQVSFDQPCQCHQPQIVIIFKLSMSSTSKISSFSNCQCHHLKIVNDYALKLSMLLPSNYKCHHLKIVNSLAFNLSMLSFLHWQCNWDQVTEFGKNPL